MRSHLAAPAPPASRPDSGATSPSRTKKASVLVEDRAVLCALGRRVDACIGILSIATAVAARENLASEAIRPSPTPPFPRPASCACRPFNSAASTENKHGRITFDMSGRPEACLLHGRVRSGCNLSMSAHASIPADGFDERAPLCGLHSLSPRR